MLKQILTHLRFLIAGRPRNDVDEELQFHLEHQVEANIAAGMTPEEARRQAAILFGSRERAREECRGQRPGYWLETLLQDARYAMRGCRRNPAFALTVVFTLMLGIGATAAVFSVVDRILFRSLPYAHADRLVSVGLLAPIEPQEFMLGGSYYEWRDHQQPFESLTSETGVEPCDLTEERPARLNCAGAESSFLPTLGISPVVGRNFTAAEDTPNAPKVALISYSVWQRRFNRDAAVVGRLIHIDGHEVRVIGVLPIDFEMPRLQPADILLPQALDEAAQRKADPGRPMWAFASLKPGITIEQAKAELQPVFEYSLRLAPAPFRKEVHLQVRSLRDRQVHDVRLTAWVLLGLVMAVLFIACANVTSLLLARGASREREVAVRSALGASRVRLIRQTLTESLVLSLAGGLAGYGFAQLLLHIFIALAPDGIPFLAKARIDTRIVLFTLLISLLCGVISGMLPAVRRPRAQLLGGRTAMNGPHATVRQWLVVAQIAASLVLLTGAALLFRSFVNLENQRLGMRAESIVTAALSLGQNAYPTPERQLAFYQQLQRNLAYGPGVAALAMSDSLPPGGYHHDQIFASISIDGRPKAPNGTGGLVAWRRVTPEYFRLLGIPMLRGAGFTENEVFSKDQFVVLSKMLADRLFPNEDPIGQHLKMAVGAAENPDYQVVGVAADVKNGGLAAGDEPEYYRLRRNQPEDWNRSAVVILKTNLPLDTMQGWIREQVTALDPTVPVEIESLSERVSKMADQPRFETWLLGFFASTGLLLAVIGLYGVISYLVTQRTQEIGVRMAMGANRADILRLVMGSGLRLILPGMFAGLLLAFGVSRLLSSLLFNIGPHDPFAFGAVTLLLMVVSFLATLIPAATATMVSPGAALRSE